MANWRARGTGANQQGAVSAVVSGCSNSLVSGTAGAVVFCQVGDCCGLRNILVYGCSGSMREMESGAIPSSSKLLKPKPLEKVWSAARFLVGHAYLYLYIWTPSYELAPVSLTILSHATPGRGAVPDPPPLYGQRQGPEDARRARRR